MWPDYSLAGPQTSREILPIVVQQSSTVTSLLAVTVCDSSTWLASNCTWVTAIKDTTLVYIQTHTCTHTCGHIYTCAQTHTYVHAHTHVHKNMQHAKEHTHFCNQPTWFTQLSACDNMVKCMPEAPCCCSGVHRSQSQLPWDCELELSDRLALGSWEVSQTWSHPAPI